jgi:hypothetical protein
MKLPTLRQVSGFAMVVNTFLPAIVVVTLGLMIWSTVTTIKRNTCATINYVTLAMNDDNERKNYIAAGDDAKKKALEDLVKRLNERPLPDNGSCGPWQDLRTRIKGILTNELYGETLKQIEYEMKVVDEKFQKAKTEVKRVIPKIPRSNLQVYPGSTRQSQQ